MSATDGFVQNAERYAAGFQKGGLPMPPGKQSAVVACMDARLNPYGVLGLSEGDSHVIRNAGGVVTDDVIRSLAISQRLLGTSEIVLIHHTGCGMLNLPDDEEGTDAAVGGGYPPTPPGPCPPPSASSGQAKSSSPPTPAAACCPPATRRKVSMPQPV